MKDKMNIIPMRHKMLPFIIVGLIIFLRAITVTLMYQSSSFLQFELFLEDITNVAHAKFGAREDCETNFRSSVNISLANSINVSTPAAPKEVIDDEKEKLLDGLLVSGFDEASCISRLESNFYHKPSPHKPSPYLISKLRKYEEIHRKCGPLTNAFNKNIKIIANSMKNNGSASTTTCKYIIWIPANGLGNQIISMVSTFLYAVLTNRVMLVKFEKDIEGLFCEPFLNSTWLLPKNSSFWNPKDVQTYQSTIEKKMPNTSNEDFPSAMYVDLRFRQNLTYARFFHCDHSQFFLSKIHLLFLESDKYFVPSIFMTPIFKEELNKMFSDITSIFHHLGRYLFHPSNEAWKLITTFYQQHLVKANEIIGLQIRVFNPKSISHQIFMSKILNCTLKNKLLPEVLSMKNTSVFSSDKNNTLMKVVLVASLYSQYGENLKMVYMNKSTVTGEIIEVHQPSKEGQQKIQDNKHNMKAWVDMYLLSLSDELVTTSKSTFGYVATGLGNSRPWIIYNPLNSEEVCEREFTLEPCSHYTPLINCNGEVMGDIASSFSNIKHCKDYPFGVKLVNNSAYL